MGGDLERTLELDGERYVLDGFSVDRESLWDTIGVDDSVS